MTAFALSTLCHGGEVCLPAHHFGIGSFGLGVKGQQPGSHELARASCERADSAVCEMEESTRGIRAGRHVMKLKDTRICIAVLVLDGGDDTAP